MCCRTQNIFSGATESSTAVIFTNLTLCPPEFEVTAEMRALTVLPPKPERKNFYSYNLHHGRYQISTINNSFSHSTIGSTPNYISIHYYLPFLVVFSLAMSWKDLLFLFSSRQTTFFQSFITTSRLLTVSSPSLSCRGLGLALLLCCSKQVVTFIASLMS